MIEIRPGTYQKHDGQSEAGFYLEAGGKAKEEEIARCLNFMGYYNHPTAGKLRAGGVSRTLYLVTLFTAATALITVFGLQNLRSASWEAEAIRAHMQLTSTQQALADQQALNHNNTADLAGCMATLDRYRSTLNQAQAKAQQAAQTNPQAANMLRLIQLLSKLL